MAYDSKYQHGLSWMHDEEEQSCIKQILKALFAALFDENSSQEVTALLLDAYETQYSVEHDEDESIKRLAGDEAYHYVRNQIWLPEFQRQLMALGVPFNKKDILGSEAFDWPESIPDRPIRTSILKRIGLQMAKADAWTVKCLRDAAKSNIWDSIG